MFRIHEDALGSKKPGTIAVYARIRAPGDGWQRDGDAIGGQRTEECDRGSFTCFRGEPSVTK